MSLISVIIPVYNTEPAYLSACLESAVNQTHRDLEIIAVDDGSLNEAPGLLDEFAGRDRRVRVLHRENGGTSVARNAGLDAASGKYILFLDADDFLEPDCCERALKRMEEEPVDILFFGYATNYTNRELRRVLKNPDREVFTGERLELAILQGDPGLGSVEVGAPWGKLIDRAVIEDGKVRYTPGLVKGQDTVFNLNLIEHCRRFDYLPFLGYHYRISSVSVSHRYNPDIVGIMERTLGAYGDFIERYGKGEAFREALEKKIWKICTGEYCSLYYVHPENPASDKEREEAFRALITREPYHSAAAAAAERHPGLWERHLLSCIRKGRIDALFRAVRCRQFMMDRLIHRFG